MTGRFCQGNENLGFHIEQSEIARSMAKGVNRYGVGKLKPRLHDKHLLSNIVVQQMLDNICVTHDNILLDN